MRDSPAGGVACVSVLTPRLSRYIVSGMEASTRGHLELLILAVLATGPAHGYAQIEALRARSLGTFDLAQGTLYPALHKLEREGLIRSHWDKVAGRKRRTYELTATGRRALADGRQRWQSVRKAIDAILGEAAWASTFG